MHFTCSTSVHRISFDIKNIHQKSHLSSITKTIVPKMPVSCKMAPYGELVLMNSKNNWGVPKSPPVEKSVYYRKFSVSVGPGGRGGTLRWGP